MTLLALTALALPFAISTSAHASDHADTPAIAANPGVDLTDVFLFPSSSNPNNVVLAMNVHPLIQPGQGGKVSFDPNVLYQFKIDNTGDFQEDLVIQAQFKGYGREQKVSISAPQKPLFPGTLNLAFRNENRWGEINEVFSPMRSVKAFAGVREDPFFFDLEQFFNIFPDRATPLTGMIVGDPNTPRQLSFRPKGKAVDFLSNGGYNVLSIVVELPRTMLIKQADENSPANSVIGLWCTTSTSPSGLSHLHLYQQVDRLARPAINEVFATVANGRHKINDETNPNQDLYNLKNDMDGFLQYPAGRSKAIRDVIEAVLIPDVLRADLSSMDNASYLGYETGGATGGKFGGRKLSDDVIDLSLATIFGNVIPSLGLAPDDGKEIPALTTDNVGPEGKHFLPNFPYLGKAR